MNKIHFSHVCDPEKWDCDSFFFPFAEKICRTRFKWIVSFYVVVRLEVRAWWLAIRGAVV